MGELVADIVGLLELGDKAESLVSEFSCTEESLTRWFRESALRWQKSDMYGVRDTRMYLPIKAARARLD